MKYLKLFESDREYAIYGFKKRVRWDNDQKDKISKFKSNLDEIEDIFLEFIDSRKCKIHYYEDSISIEIPDGIKWSGNHKSCDNIGEFEKSILESEESIVLMKKLKTPMLRLDNLRLKWEFNRIKDPTGSHYEIYIYL